MAPSNVSDLSPALFHTGSRSLSGNLLLANCVQMRACLCIAVLLFSALVVLSQEASPKKAPADVMREIRLRVLSTPPSQMGRQPTKEFPHVYAMIMDWPVEGATVSLMASSVGDGSIYTTGNFGVFGGIGYENVRNSAGALVRLAEKYYSDAVPAKEFPYPKTGQVYFYLICYDGVRLIDADATHLTTEKGKYSDLFAQAQTVINELRQIAQSQKTGTQ